jgi:hypothetical protein
MQCLLEPFESHREARRVPILAITFALATLAVTAWVTWLVWDISLRAPATMQRNEANAAHQERLEDQQTQAERSRVLQALMSPPALLETPHSTVPELITVNPSNAKPLHIITGGSATLDRPVRTVDGSYYGQIDPATGLPKTVYISDPGKFVVDVSAATPAPSPRGGTRTRIYAPTAAAPVD